MAFLLGINWNLVLVGLGIGALVGLTGVGGGSLMTPILIVFFRLPPSVAIGTDLVNAAITKVVGAAQHMRQGTVDLAIVGNLAVGSVPAAIFGVGLVKIIRTAWGDSGETVLTVILAWTLILVALVMLARIVFGERLADLGKRSGLKTPARRRVLTAILGLVAGILVSLTSVGAGSIVMVLLVILYAASAKRLVGTDIVHAAMLASVAAIGHLWAGDVNWSVALTLLLGSIPGVLLGSRMSLKLPDTVLRVALALTLMFSGMRLIAQ